MNRCASCNGRKKVSPLGGIEKNCPDCNGLGYSDTKPAIPLLHNIEQPPLPKTKRINKDHPLRNIVESVSSQLVGQ